MALQTIGILAVDGAQLLDVGGPADVFAEANRHLEREAYEIRVLAAEPGAIRASCGMRLTADAVLGRDHERIDTLLVAGAPHLDHHAHDGDLVKRVREAALAARRYGSVCTGAFLLAQTGLLAGRRVTTHWASAARFAADFPDVLLEPDAIHLRDGPVRTAAGVTAGLDLALALVEEDLGVDVARAVASQLVMFFRRPGGQLQYSRDRRSTPVGRSVLQEVQRWVMAHPEAEHGVADLAGRAGLSPRHFARLFRAEVGVTPSAWVESARIEVARKLLEEGLPPKLAGVRSGFRDVETFRRAFARQLGISPAAYRSRQRSETSS